MYIDNGSDPADSGELKIDVDGHEYTEQENFSSEHNGVIDSVAIDTADGHHLVYSDDHHTGSADVVTEYDAHGDEVREAHFDTNTGHWVDSGGADGQGDSGSAAGDAGHSGSSGEQMSVDTPGGEQNIGPATVDTTNSGHPDTAVVHDSNGDTIMYTDTNGDGQADVATEITPDGHVVIAEHTGAHQWTVVEKGHLDGNGQYHSDGESSGSFDPQVGPPAAGGSAAADVADDHYWAGEQGAAATAGAEAEGAKIGQTLNSMFGAGQGVVRIDSSTGQWISPN